MMFRKRATVTSSAALILALGANAEVLPSYALTNAPYIYLQGSETYFPSDIVTHLQHVTPQVNRTKIADSISLGDLGNLNSDTFLTSNDPVTADDQPTISWLLSNYGKPDSSGLSGGPATIIAVKKPDDIVDVFYFLFYSFDLGNTAVGIRFGNHIGDWEHQMVRFTNGAPTNIYLSAHSGGSAYTWNALPKASGTQRPITYVAKGTHANYATSGRQPYPIPIIGPIADQTSKGYFWDVTKNYRGYWFDTTSNTFSAAGGAGSGGSEQAGETASWLNFRGRWGDDVPSDDTDGQYCISTECHYVAGPTGPLDKNLGRTAVCQNEGDCSVKSSAKTVTVPDNIDEQMAELAAQLKVAEARGLLTEIPRESA